MFGRKKVRLLCLQRAPCRWRQILGCDEREPAESRLQRATFLELFSAQSRAHLEQRKGNAAAIGAMGLLYDEAV